MWIWLFHWLWHRHKVILKKIWWANIYWCFSFIFAFLRTILIWMMSIFLIWFRYLIDFPSITHFYRFETLLSRCNCILRYQTILLIQLGNVVAWARSLLLLSFPLNGLIMTFLSSKWKEYRLKFANLVRYYIDRLIIWLSISSRAHRIIYLLENVCI